MGRFRDLTGCNFGRLKVIRRGGDYIYPNGRRRPRWECLCSCGNTTVVSANNLIKGVTTSCGCFQKENMSKLKRKHGGYADREPLFSIWCGVRKRCLSPKASNYSNYGGRGISICKEWKDNYDSFRIWSIKNGYRQGLSLDRIDNNSGYSPENCRWTTPIVQQNNRRSNINIAYNGETHTLKEWSRIIGISYSTLYQRYKYGWNIKRMLNIND